MRFTFIAIVAGLGGLLFGYDTGVISGALLYIRHVFHLGPAWQGIVVAIALAAAAAGAAIAGWLSDALGRRPVLLAAGVLFIAGAILSGVAWSIGVLLAGRVLVGAGIGVASMLTPLYLSEMAPPDKRGAVVTINQFYITFGILLSYLIGFGLSHAGSGWRIMLALGAVPGIVLFGAMLYLPESPRWLAGKHRDEEARHALSFLRGHDVEEELRELRHDLAREGNRTAPWSEILAPKARMPLVVGVGLAIFQQITGINTVIYFAPTIFQHAGLPSASASILATAGVGAVNVLMTLLALRLLDIVGRRRMLLIGLGGMLLTLLFIASAFMAGLGGGFLSVITVCSVAVYVGFFAIGLGPVFWLLIAEIFPLAIRGRGMSAATIANWLFNMLISLTFLDLVHLAGRGPTFLVYAAMTLITIVFTWRYVPETKGRSLEQIEEALEGNAQLAE